MLRHPPWSRTQRPHDGSEQLVQIPEPSRYRMHLPDLGGELDLAEDLGSPVSNGTFGQMSRRTDSTAYERVVVGGAPRTPVEPDVAGSKLGLESSSNRDCVAQFGVREASAFAAV